MNFNHPPRSNVLHTFTFCLSFILVIANYQGYAQCTIGGTVIPVSSLPFLETDFTTCGAGDNLNGSNTINCGSSSYLAGEELIFTFQVTTDTLYHIILTNTSTNWTSLKLWQNCPLTGEGGSCVSSIAGSSNNKILEVWLTPGITYYLAVSSSNAGCFNFDLEIDFPKSCPEPGEAGWQAITLPFAQNGLTTCGMGDDLRGFNTINCGSSSYLDSEDMVFIFQAPATDYYHFAITHATQGWIGIKLYDGCPLLNQGSSCVAQKSTSGSNLILGADLEQNQTYYLVVSRSGEACFDFNLTIDLPETCPTPGTPGWDAISLPFSQSGLTTCGMGDNLGGYNTVSCGSASYLNSEDMVFIFEAPSSDSWDFTVTDASQGWIGLKLFNGCPLLDQGGSCVAQNSTSGSNLILSSNLEQGQTYYLVVSRSGAACFDFTLSIGTPETCPGPGAQGWEAISLPFSQTGLTTCGMGDNLGSYNTINCGSMAYLNSEEIVYIFEATQSEFYHFTITNATQSWIAMKLYDGCPLLNQGGSCVASNTTSGSNLIMGADLEQGQTYYLVVSRSGSVCYDFDLTIDLPATCPDPGSHGWPQITLPFAESGLTTCGMGNDLFGFNTISCGGSSYLGSEEVVFIFQASTTEEHRIAISNSSAGWTSLKLFNGCPLLSFGAECIGQVSGSSAEKLLDVMLEAGQQYYLVISRWGADCFDFDLSINAFCQVPIPVVVQPDPICSGEAMPVLTVSNPAGEIRWYADPGLNHFLANGPEYQPQGETSTIVYTTQTLGCESAASKTIVTVYSPAAISLLQGEEGIFLQEKQLHYAHTIHNYSSQQSATGNTVNNLAGQPSVYPQYGNLPGAWMPSGENNREYVDVSFLNPQAASSVIIYETFHPGSIDTLWAFHPEQQYWTILWTGMAMAAEEEARIFQINFPETGFEINRIRIAMDTEAVNGIPAIDAIALMNPGNVVCGNQFITLRLNAGSDILWSTGETGESISFIPNQPQTIVTAESQLYGCSFTSTIHITLADDVSPEPVSNMTPENGAINVSLTPALNWMNGANTSDVDIYFWASEQNQPEEPLVNSFTGLQITIPREETMPDSQYRWQVVSNHYLCNSISGPIQSFITRDLPNLQISNVQVETEGFVGQPVSVSFVVTNAGNASTGPTPWADAVFLSLDDQLDLAEDVLLGGASNPRFLLPGESYTQTLELMIPRENLGNYHVIVAANYSCKKTFAGTDQVNYTIACNVLLEETTMEDNLYVSQTSIQFTLPPLPDLEVTSFFATEIAFAGDTITLTYQVQNTGDAFALSQNYRLAYNLCKSGWHSDVSYGKNAGEQNKNFAWEIMSPEMWAGVVSRYCALIEPFWLDEVYLADSDPGFLPDEAIRLGSELIHFKMENYLAAGYDLPEEYGFNPLSMRIQTLQQWDSVAGYLDVNSSYQRQLQIVLPNCIDGDYFLYIRTDHHNWAWESNTSNNMQIRGIQILPTPPPDLIVSDIEPEEEIFSGQRIPFNYTIANNGAGKPSSSHWIDLIYLSPTQELDTVTATLLKRHPVSQGLLLEPGAIKEVNTHVTIPNGIEGAYYLIVHVNGYEMVCEFDMENNITSYAVDIQLTPPPDLTVISIDVPEEIRAETVIDFAYTVENSGPGTAMGPWTDKVFLSASDSFVYLEENMIASINRSDTLMGGDSYTLERELRIPRVAPGTWYLYVFTDSRNQVYEHGEEENNIKRHGPIEMLPRITSDLLIEEINAPNNGLAGQKITYSYTVTNSGEGITNAHGWFDVVFINTQPILTSEAIRLARRQHMDALDVNESYERSGTVRIPHGLEGSWYLLTIADFYLDVENDEDRDNNLLAHPIELTQPPTPDLVMEHIDLPDFFTAGDEVFITYSVTNQGEAPADTTWFDSMMLKLTPQSSAKTLGFRQQQRIVPPGETFTDSMLVAIPLYYSGNYYFVASLDHRNHIYEHQGEDNNKTYYPVFISPALPADLIVEEIIAPQSAIPGRATSYTYTITNIGENPSRGSFFNNVYLESGFLLPDLSNTMLWGSNRFPSYIINPGDSQTFILDKNFPGVKDGMFETLVLANATLSVPETDFNNNTLYAHQPIESSMPLLPLNEWVSDTLAGYSSVYYRLGLPEGADLRVTLHSNLTFTQNALYMRHEDVPTGPFWDYRHSGSNKASPTLLIPGTLEGDNFLKIKSYTFFFQNIDIRADVLPFGIDSITPAVMGQGRVTSMIYGAGFREGAVVELTDSENITVVQGTILQFRSSMELQVRWQLEEVPAGVYNLKVTNPDNSNELLSMAVTVEPAREMEVTLMPVYNAVIGVRNPTTVGIVFTNTSNVDAPYTQSRIYFRAAHELVGIASDSKTITLREKAEALSGIQLNDLPDYLIHQSPFDEPDYKYTPLLIRDLSPGESANASMTFRNFPYPVFGLSHSLELLTAKEYLDQITYNALTKRDFVLSNPIYFEEMNFEASQQAELINYLSNEDAYLEALYTQFIEAGLLAAQDTIGYTFDCPDCIFTQSFNTSSATFADGMVDVFDASSSLWLQKNNPGPADGCEGPSGQNFINNACHWWGIFSNVVYCATAITCGVAAAMLIFGGTASVVGAAPAYAVTLSLYFACKTAIVGCGMVLGGVEITGMDGVLCALVVRPCDPNEIQGPWGFGDEQFIAQKETVNYTVYFENDPDFADSPAQGVRINVPISENANPLSVRLGSFGFADYTFDVPANQASYTQRLDLTQEEGYFLDVVAGLDINNNRIFWLFETIDPVTGTTPIDPFNGFLAVNDTTGVGEGFVEFSIVAHESTVTGDTLSHYADIYFDLNPPITTNTHFNTVDAFPPTTIVEVLPQISLDHQVKLTIQAEDDTGGSGLDFVEVYISRNGNDFELFGRENQLAWLVQAESCDSLAFFVRSTDKVGNTEPLTFEAQTFTIIGREDVSAGEDVTICRGEEVQLTASRGATYLWNTGDTNQTITVSPDSTSVYSVIVRNEQGCPGIASVKVEVEECTGIDEMSAESRRMKVFPNPVFDGRTFLQLEGFESGSYQLTLLDSNGRKVWSQKLMITTALHDESLHITGLPAGNYILELSGNDQTEAIKLVISR
ncbi:MAG: T9SS C-terminal target domain-containing protein [Bacteroidetes bacterium]|nr:MAG: T9SS C-terminal target domain-containing protein [Bacteroidota bacterium]